MSGNVRRESATLPESSAHIATHQNGDPYLHGMKITRREEPSSNQTLLDNPPLSSMIFPAGNLSIDDIPMIVPLKPSFRLGISQLDMFDKTAAVSITGVNSPSAVPGSIALRTWHECLSTLQLESCRWRCYKNCSRWFSLLTYIYMYIYIHSKYIPWIKNII